MKILIKIAQMLDFWNMESLESVCLGAGGALRLKFIENLMENFIDAGF